jgi:hypothetical protein
LSSSKFPSLFHFATLFCAFKRKRVEKTGVRAMAVSLVVVLFSALLCFPRGSAAATSNRQACCVVFFFLLFSSPPALISPLIFQGAAATTTNGRACRAIFATPTGSASSNGTVAAPASLIQ